HLSPGSVSCRTDRDGESCETTSFPLLQASGETLDGIARPIQGDGGKGLGPAGFGRRSAQQFLRSRFVRLQRFDKEKYDAGLPGLLMRGHEAHSRQQGRWVGHNVVVPDPIADALCVCEWQMFARTL